MMRGERQKGGVWRALFLGCLLLSIGISCGRKAPPVPPNFDGLTVPAGVSASLVGERVVVSWSDPPFSERSWVTGYRVYLSILEEGEKECTGCPIRFEKIGETASDVRRFDFSASLGVLYTIEVRSGAEGGYLSDPSRRVVVDLRGEMPAESVE